MSPVFLLSGAVVGLAAGGPGVWVLLVVLLFGSGFFSGCETGVVSVSRARLGRLAGEGNRDAKTTLRLLQDTPATIAATLVGTNLCNIGAASLATAIAVGFSPQYGPLIATAVLTPVALFGAEIVPKALYRSRPTRLLLASAGALGLFNVLFRPVVALSTGATKALLFLLRVPPAERKPVFGRDDLENLFLFGAVHEADGEDDGTRETLRMAGRVLELVRRSVSEAMVPLPPDPSCRFSDTVEDAVALFRESGRKILVALDGHGAVAGFVAAKELLGEAGSGPLAPFVRPAYPLRPEDTLDAAITGLRRSRLSVAVVRDAEGGTLGLVTPEDLLEEIVGEIRRIAPRPGGAGKP